MPEASRPAPRASGIDHIEQQLSGGWLASVSDRMAPWLVPGRAEAAKRGEPPFPYCSQRTLVRASDPVPTAHGMTGGRLGIAMGRRGWRSPRSDSDLPVKTTATGLGWDIWPTGS
jgi:hypothetical protein